MTPSASGSRARQILKSGVVLAGLLIFNHYLEHRGFFEPYTIASYDWMQRLVRQAKPAVTEPLVTIFTLGPDVHGQEIEVTIARMIQIIACGEPAVIGVDWRTGNWNPQTLSELQTGPASRVPIVWARETNAVGKPGTVAAEVALPSHWSTGIAAVPEDWDHSIRRHQRWFAPDRESFSWVIAKTYCRVPGVKAPGCPRIDRCAEEHCEAEGLLDFTNGSDTVDWFPAEVPLALSSRSPTGCSALPESGHSQSIKGRVVLIGDGSSADMHSSPLGRKLGVQIMGHAVQSDLFGASLQTTNGWLLFLLHLLSIIFVLQVNRLPSFVALAVNLLGLPFICVVLSFLAYRSAYHWFNFAPLIGGVIIHQLWEQAELNQALGKKVKHLESRECVARHGDGSQR